MLLSFLLSISFLSPSKDSAVVKKINAQMLHPRERIWAFPVNGVKIDAKEACLLWPATEGKTVEYKIALAKDSLFTSNATFSDVQKWAVYPIHQQLQTGNWFWKCGSRTSPTADWKWSSIYRFQIAEGENQISSPSALLVLKKIKSQKHPTLGELGAKGEDFIKKLNKPRSKSFDQ